MIAAWHLSTYHAPFDVQRSISCLRAIYCGICACTYTIADDEFFDLDRQEVLVSGKIAYLM